MALLLEVLVVVAAEMHVVVPSVEAEAEDTLEEALALNLHLIRQAEEEALIIRVQINLIHQVFKKITVRLQ